MGIGYEIGSAVAGIAGGIYDIWSKERDFDYQKRMQNTIFEREDNAIQRRVEDFKKAGLNPNLAAGSAAGAGAVVGRSTTSGNPIGTALDNAAAVAQLSQQRIQQQILNNEKQISDINVKQAERWNQFDDLENKLEMASLLYQLGVDSDMSIRKVGNNFGIRSNALRDLPDGDYQIYDSPLMQQLRWQTQNNKNAADMLQKDNEFYVGDKIANYLGVGASIFGGMGAGTLNFSKVRNMNKAYRRY